MQETLGKVAMPVLWLGVIGFVVGVLVHFGGGIFLTITSGAFLEFAKTCFLFTMAVSLLGKGS